MKKNLLLFFLFIIAGGQAKAQWTYDSLSFETPTTKIIIDTTGGNLWSIGKPQKTFFDSAHSTTKAIVTDTISNYPPNDTSSFIYIIRNPYTQTCITCMEFWHKYDMDSLDDKGIIDASYDGGNSWLLVSDTSNNPFGFNFMWGGDYHASNGNYTNHNLVTSGKSDGWIQSSFCWQWYLPVKTDTIIIMPDSLMIRFTFISDSIIKNKEGWMIDDIVTSSGGEQQCSGIKEKLFDSNISIFPNPFSTQTTLYSDNLLKNATLTVYNSFGRQVTQSVIPSGARNLTIYRNNLPSGLYFIRLTEENKIYTDKLVITD